MNLTYASACLNYQPETFHTVAVHLVIDIASERLPPKDEGQFTRRLIAGCTGR